jgi:hypothetical protein
MVTGIETAGLVLAAFPLVVCTIQSYREGLEPLGDWWQYRTKVLKFAQGLKVQWDIFQENVRMLLDPMVTSTWELEELLSDPAGPKWQEPGLICKLEQRLPRSYDSYMCTIEAMKEALEKLKKKLGVDGKV